MRYSQTRPWKLLNLLSTRFFTARMKRDALRYEEHLLDVESLFVEMLVMSWLSLSRLLLLHPKIEAANAREKWAEHEDHE